jgi:hypothetical protein
VNEPNKIYAQKGLSGGMSSSRGKGYIEINQSMTEFFLDLSEEGTPFATRIVCIRIRKKGADTCTDCLILTNEFRMRLNRAPVENNNEDEGGENSNSNGEELDSYGKKTE